MSVGYDHVDLTACKNRNIPVGHTPNVLTDAVAELTMALLLATARRIHEGRLGDQDDYTMIRTHKTSFTVVSMYFLLCRY